MQPLVSPVVSRLKVGGKQPVFDTPYHSAPATGGDGFGGSQSVNRCAALTPVSVGDAGGRRQNGPLKI